MKNANRSLAIARHEVLLSLSELLFAANRYLKPGGHFFMIHRPHRLTDILHEMRELRLEPKRLRFVQPFSDKPPNMVLIEAVRGGKPLLVTEPALIIYNRDLSYTEEVAKLYYE